VLFVAVTGPSGGGKSTLLALLAALDRPTVGRVALDGRDLSAASEAERTRARRRVGLVFQSAPMLRRLPAWENVALPLVPRGVPASDRRARALQALDRVGLAVRAESPPEELSAGEAQRVGVARALVTGPDLLVADEPTSSLDARSAASVVDLLAAFHAAGGTVVVATHDPALLARAGRVVVLEAGRLVRG
jgi:putative ABC transport system ATP-binding protein